MEEKRFTLRMDGDLFQEISELAKKNRRSIAKEIEYAIAYYLHEEAMNEYFKDRNLDELTDEESREHLRHLRELNQKYMITLNRL